MPKNKVTVKNFNKVIENIKSHFNSCDKDCKKYYAEMLESMLDEMHGNDFFGTEGQIDPRGDQRD